MGMYTWLSDSEFIFYSGVSDTGINEALQEVRSVMPEWYIQEKIDQKKTFWGKVKVTYSYNVFHRTKPNYSEVRYQMSASKKNEVLNLLYGLYMGYHKAKEDERS